MSLPVAPNFHSAISVRTDFSSCSEAALPYCYCVSRRYRGVLNIVTVVSAEIWAMRSLRIRTTLDISAVDKMEHLVTSEMFQGINHQELVEESEGDIPLVLTE